MERDFINRQMSVLKSSIDDFRQGSTSLNTLVERVEGLAGVIDDAAFQGAADEIVLSLEQINASILEGAPKTAADVEVIRADLEKLDALVAKYSSPVNEDEW
jgi:hypothetical protein